MDNKVLQKLQQKLAIGLFGLRITIAVVFIMWAFDKVFMPEHAIKVFVAFYGLELSESIPFAIGIVQLLFIGVFVAGLWKNVTYLIVLLLHAASTFSAFHLYIDPFNNLLFFAAWPMLGACFALYILRDFDVWSLGSSRQLAKA